MWERNAGNYTRLQTTTLVPMANSAGGGCVFRHTEGEERPWGLGALDLRLVVTGRAERAENKGRAGPLYDAINADVGAH